MTELVAGQPALARTGPEAIAALTEAATRSTYYADWMDAEQHASIARIVDLAAPACAAADGAHGQFIAAFVDGVFAGFAIATLHAEDDRELDWLMVHPDFQGRGVAVALMEAGMAWLGTDRPMWLNVVRHNERALRFYRRFGFEVDPATSLARAIPMHVMRRPPD
ncbi:MAG TPA: GNAT family N-acetyltransferase [Allosphingosinicella sp.]|nr:GNAT family N-acetyltransferase [Allosphingosinicella sp.]